jgi:hypothetical protein
MGKIEKFEDIDTMSLGLRVARFEIFKGSKFK